MPACREGAEGPFSFPGHSRLRSIKSMPRPEFGHLRAMPSMAGRDTSRTANTAPDISAGLRRSMTVCIVRTGLISSLVHTADERDTLARLHALRNYCRHMPVLPCGRLHALKIEQVLIAGLEIIDVE